jgi:hypothetical protein
MSSLRSVRGNGNALAVRGDGGNTRAHADRRRAIRGAIKTEHFSRDVIHLAGLREAHPSPVGGDRGGGGVIHPGIRMLLLVAREQTY